MPQRHTFTSGYSALAFTSGYHGHPLNVIAVRSHREAVDVMVIDAVITALGSGMTGRVISEQQIT